MGDPWGSAIRGFERGVPLGVRSAERAEDKAEREAKGKKDEAFRNRGRAIEEAREGREKEAFDSKKAAEIANLQLSIARAHDLAGRELPAIKAVMDTYKEIPNGDEIIIIPENDEFGGRIQGGSFSLVSKVYGETKFKNVRDIIKHASKLAKAKTISDSMDANDRSLAQENSDLERKPYLKEDGKRYIEQKKLGPGGAHVFDKEIPYEGIARMGKVRAGLVDEGLAGTDKQVEIKLGLKGKPTETTAKDLAELEGKNLDAMRKKFDLAMKPFTTSAKSVFDFKTGQVTTEGGNAIASARKLVEKSETNPKSLTSIDKKNLPMAINGLALYNRISAAVTESGGGASGDYPPKRAPDGKLYTKKNGIIYLVEEEDTKKPKLVRSKDWGK